MRVIRGQFKGRTLVAPSGRNTRPTGDRVRESLFQILESRWLEDGFRDRVVFDLYAGSGSLGIEALSRGARCVAFFEKDARACRAIRANLDALGVDPSRYSIIKRGLPDGLDGYRARPGDDALELATVVLSDPPYDHNDTAELANALADHAGIARDAVWCHESASNRDLHLAPWIEHDVRDYGQARIRFLSRS